MLEDGKKYIVEARFAWTDCKQYEYVYGECFLFDADKEAGFVLRRSENWFIKVKGDKGEVIIPGCRVGTLVRTDVVPEVVIPTKEELENLRGVRPIGLLVL